tara:strand:- start:84615 stop:85196 length:582 start_codon:yes stop_codon:yes gene_type:complete
MYRFKIILVIILFFTVQAGFSQINLGLKIGGNYNFNGFESDSLDLSFNNAVSFQGGGLIRLKIKKVHLQVEGLFTQRKGEALYNSGSSRINFYSFDVPLIIGFKLIDLKVVKLRLNAGLIPSFTMAQFGDLDKNSYNDSFYSATGGVSLDIPLFLFDFRYQGAIGDYYQLQNVNSTTTLSNSLVSFSVAWKII